MSTFDYPEPTSQEEAKAQLADIKLKKQELSNRKKELVEQQRVIKADYTDKTRERAMMGKGVGSLISKKVDKTATKAKEYADAKDRKEMGEKLEPVEKEREEIEAQLQELATAKLTIDSWVASDKAAKAAAKAAAA